MTGDISHTVIWVSAAVVIVLMWAAHFLGYWLGCRNGNLREWNRGHDVGWRDGYAAGKRDNQPWTPQPRERNGRFASNKETL